MLMLLFVLYSFYSKLVHIPQEQKLLFLRRRRPEDQIDLDGIVLSENKCYFVAHQSRKGFLLWRIKDPHSSPNCRRQKTELRQLALRLNYHLFLVTKESGQHFSR